MVDVALYLYVTNYYSMSAIRAGYFVIPVWNLLI